MGEANGDLLARETELAAIGRLAAVTNVTAGDLVRVICTKSGAAAGSASDSKLIAIPVG